MADDKRTKSPEKPKVAKMDFFSSGEEEEPEPDTGETKELLIEDRAAVVGVILIVQSKYVLIDMPPGITKKVTVAADFTYNMYNFQFQGVFQFD